MLAASAALLAASGLVVTSPAAAEPATSAWEIQSSPNVGVPGGEIQSVSCLSADACTAVGLNVNNSGVLTTLAEAWNGATWTVETTPQVNEGDLLGVSCISADFCEAVGSYDNSSDISAGLGEFWNGMTWAVQSVPVPSGATSAELNAVSCSTGGTCEAVGYYDTSAGTLALAEAFNGTTWSQQSVPSLSGVSFPDLNGVSCSTPTSCEAVGSGLAEKLSGTTWTAQSIATPTGGSSPWLSGVSCVDASSCEAVGFFENSAAAEVALTEKWNGTTWSSQSNHDPSGSTSSVLNAVSCAGGTCEAVGDYTNSSGKYLGLAERWGGAAWNLQTPPSPASAMDTYIEGVSCTSSDGCESGGYFGTGGYEALAEVWNGTSWKTQAAARPASATINDLYSVSCVSADFCEAVGAHWSYGGGVPETALAEVWNGTSWTVQSTPDPTTGTNGELGRLYGVSCYSADFCEAVGYSSGTSDGGLLEIWNGTSWSMQTGSTGFNYLDSVSCTSEDFCEAVGSGFDIGNAETFDGTSWTAQATPDPGSPPSGVLTGVSCLSSTSCEAVGYSNSGIYADSWGGSSWSLQTVPAPSGATSEHLNSVSCVSGSFCEAAGYSEGSSGYSTLIETYNGASWSVQASANPVGAVGPQFNGVSCTSISACTAVGWYENPSNVVTLAEVWNGTSWQTQSTPNRTSNSVLNGVSCGAPGTCEAVGSAPDKGGTTATLIEAGD